VVQEWRGAAVAFRGSLGLWVRWSAGPVRPCGIRHRRGSSPIHLCRTRACVYVAVACSRRVYVACMAVVTYALVLLARPPLVCHHTHTHIPQTNGTTALVYAKRDLDRQDRPTTRSRRLSQLPSTAGREQDHTRTSSIACTHACPDACACSGTGHRWALAMQSLKRRPCMPCDKGRNGACMHGDGRRQHHAARRSESPAMRLHPSGGQGGQARKATKARRIPLARS